MNLSNHNLTFGMQGEEIARLQRDLRIIGLSLDAEEIRQNLFGNTTRQAVIEIQRRQGTGFEASGEVDSRTAWAIHATVEAAQPLPGRFIVRGQILGQFPPRMLVRAFDQDLRNLQELGQTSSNERGQYEIPYTADRFSRAEKKSADLVVKCFSQDGRTEIGASEIIFNAAALEIVDPVITQTQLSEYDRYLAEIIPILENVELAALTVRDISFLAGETGIERQRIEFLRKSAQLARDTQLPIEAFYGWARIGVPLDLAQLLARPSQTLRRTLDAAIARNIIPRRIQAALDVIVARLEELRRERGFTDGRGLISHEVIGQLLNRETNAPLPHFTVRAFDLDDGAQPRSLGADLTNHQGFFALTYTTPRETQPAPERRLRLHILDTQRSEIHQTEVMVPANQHQVLQVRIPIPPVPEPLSPSVTNLATASRLELPQQLLAYLTEKGIRTLADIRKAGGISHLDRLPVATDHPVVRALEAHANLSLLSSDIDLNAKLIENGFTSALTVASAPRTRFVAVARELVGDFKAAQMHVMARAQNDFLNNKMTAHLAFMSNGYVDETMTSPGSATLTALLPKRCACKDCESAVSPLAYLADLLDYAVEHLEKEDGTAISLQFLTSAFHQPFGKLPASCKEMDKKVRQARICVEVLRRYLKAKNLPVGAKQTMLNKEEKNYRLETYQLLLTKIGTSYEEIRLARAADTEKRKALADRLGIEVGATKPDHLDLLFLDPAATPAIPEKELEKIFGLVDTSKSDPLAEVEPAQFLTWRLAYLRTQWKEQDRPTDQYSEDFLPVEDRLPIIDPDLIGPDDFREPFKKANPNDPDQVFDIWFRRRQWVDDRLEALAGLKKPKEVGGQQTQVPDLEAMLSSMFEDVSYANTIIQPWVNTQPDKFDGLLKTLSAGTESEVKAAKAQIRSDLRLTAESFTRLMAIRNKDLMAESNAKNEPVKDDEWAEVYSILSQAQKERFFPPWIAEEVAQGTLFGPQEYFGPREFWIPLREPKEGAWPPAFPEGQPMIDPEVLNSEDLPDPTAGKRAHEIFEARRKEIETIKDKLKTLRETSTGVAAGFEAILNEALGSPHPDLDLLSSNLTNPDPAVVATAKETIRNDLHMTVEAFTRLMNIKTKGELTEEEWNEVYAILTSVQKVRTKFGVTGPWLAEENNSTTGVVYWSALKASLPRWRATAEARQRWLQALRTRSQAPLIDPDLIGKDDLKQPNTGPAATLWNSRKNQIKTQLDGFKAVSQTADGLETIIAQALGAPADELKALDELRRKGEDIESRQDQLSLGADAFSYLLRILALVESPQPVVLPSEWDEVYSILTQVQKRRSFARWRQEEKTAGLTLGPDYFQFPEADFTTFPAPSPPELPEWRATVEARRDWQDTLQSRIDQEKAVIEALQEVVSSTEAATLPRLRDALVMASDANGMGLEAKAKWVTDKLLIDAKASGCQMTTRISQAIETVQGILFSVRTGQLQDTHPLALNADHFDEEWEWIGSYATWRAAMFVFLYPENILQPSLRRWQTPAFRTLVRNLRSNRRLSPEQAREAARSYSMYFEDVSNLTLEAACETRAGISCYVLYLFGRGPATNKVYWSAYDPLDPPDYSQTFWEEVPGLTNTIKVIGAAPYEITPVERFIFLFAITREKATKKLMFTRYDLEKERWDDEPAELELPEDAAEFSAVVSQSRNETNPPRLAIRVSKSTAVYVRRLNQDGSAWAEGDWKPTLGCLRGAEFQDIFALVETIPDKPGPNESVAPGEFYLIMTGGKYGSAWYRLFGGKDDGRWRTLGDFPLLGAFIWPGSTDLYVFKRNYNYTWASLITASDSAVEQESIGTLADLESWLSDQAGVSLNQIKVPEGSPYSGMTLLDFFGLKNGGSFDEVYDAFLPGLSNLILAVRRILCINWLAGEIEKTTDYIDSESNVFGSWKLADEMIREFTTSGRSLGDALMNILPVNFDSVDDQPKTLGSVEFRERVDPVDLGQFPATNSLSGLSGLERIVPSCGFTANTMQVYLRSGGHQGIFRNTFHRDGDVEVTLSTPIRVTPLVTGPYDITERLSESQLQARSALSEQNFKDNENGPRSNLIYLEEANYFVPVHLALQLQQRGQFTAALDWFRTVYDYSMPRAQRKIYYGLIKEETIPSSSLYKHSDENWLLDPLNPHSIAETRRKTYTRFTLLSLIRCFLEFADAEFTRDTAESVPRARTLYMTALELLDSAELKQSLLGCSDIIGTLEIDIGDSQASSDFNALKKELTHINNFTVLEKTINDIKAVFAGAGTLETHFAQARQIVGQALAATPPAHDMEAAVEGKASQLVKTQAMLLAQPEIASSAQRVGTTAAREFKNRVSLITGLGGDALEKKSAELPWMREKMPAGVRRAGTGTGQPVRLLFGAGEDGNQSLRKLNPLAPTAIARKAQVAFDEPLLATKVIITNPSVVISVPSFEFCVPPNPIIKALRLWAELNLYKLRNCRNIAGMVRQLEPYAAPTDTVSGLPMIGEGGQLVLPGLIKFPPTPYRYLALVERAKHLVGLAQQTEAAFLSALEKADAERYTLLKARQDVRLAKAGVRLQELRVKEAEGGVKLAELQQERAQIQADHYKKLLDEGLTEFEQMGLGFLQEATKGYAAASLAAAIPNIIAGLASGAIIDYAGIHASLAQAASAFSTYYLTLASYERQAQGWEFQRAVALQDVKIGVQQVKVAEDHVRVVGQERVIAEMLSEHAEAVVDFLSNKFTNVELYDWMSQILESVYSFFLQQATAMAQLAANQLSFERQEAPPPYIQADYWEAPNEGGMGSNTDGTALDRRGLTGSTRLLQDIYQLDQYAFETNKRKLQLTKTISLASMVPAEFQRFRETGVMLFATPMEMFDRDFPGHYLRLIRRVRASVIALIPPSQGIRATLSSTAISRVVIGGDVFQTVAINHSPQIVALSSPRDATGLFELEQQSDMLNPFEGMGVDAGWELRMPKAANLFDYRAIADVLITIDYTALNSFDYYQQVIQTLKPTLSANRPFSFRHQFADQWYDLHNPDLTSTPMTVRFTTVRDDFPPNLDKLKIQQVALYFARASGKLFETPVSHLHFTEQGGAGTVGGGAASIDGIISTLKGNAGSWTALIGKAPFGEWELALPNTMEMKNRFNKEEIEDILFVITYSGRTPEWPA